MCTPVTINSITTLFQTVLQRQQDSMFSLFVPEKSSYGETGDFLCWQCSDESELRGCERILDQFI